MYYRSDWPEVGLSCALNSSNSIDFTGTADEDKGWVRETNAYGAVFQLTVNIDKFESNLYGMPMCNLHLEVHDADCHLLPEGLDNPIFQKVVIDEISQLLHNPPWGNAYVHSKLVKNEPLYGILRQFAFEEVEQRRLYWCKVRDIISAPLKVDQDQIQYTSMAAVVPDLLTTYQRKVLDICREAFADRGYSRHFTDPVLLERLPGLAYILAMMQLNIKYVSPSLFLVAVDNDGDQLCGFSVIGKKPGLKKDTYTQLLSASRKAYRRRGVYRGLTHLLSQTLPPDATLLNVTHVKNVGIQKAYLGSGRIHLADTVILSRVF